jgi:RNase P subunit RPR2
MIKVLFKCEKCGKEQKINYDDIEEKNIVPICDKCYEIFWNTRCALVQSIKQLYSEYHISIETFDAGDIQD